MQDNKKIIDFLERKGIKRWILVICFDNIYLDGKQSRTVEKPKQNLRD